MKFFRLLFVSALLATTSCDLLVTPGSRQGKIIIRFEEASVPTRASNVPDTNGFLLSVSDSKGASIYNGTYGAAPETILADPGKYTVSARSCEFVEPAFDTPQYGDSQTVTVKEGETSVVILVCSQLNCGVRLNYDNAFLSEFPTSSLFLKSAAGKLLYGYSEKRVAYFPPGKLSVVMSGDGADKTIFSRTLQASQMLSLGISVSASSSQNSVEIKIDTTRTWIDDSVNIGGGSGGSSSPGGSQDSAFSVSKARESAGTDDVWVYGYIVGGDLSSSKCSFTAPFSSRTNLVLATKSTCTDRSICLSVQLAKGDIRDEINLVDHPDLLGRQIFLKGDIVASYYGLPGLQNLSEYEFR